MAYTPSPLRYPGGKTSIWKIIAQIIRDNQLGCRHYVEPYAGGCGLALSLMFKGYVHELHLNDIDRSIWSLWNAILNNTENFIKKIKKTEVTIDEWYRQREIQKNKDLADDFELAFSSFFLNRTNRSGIIFKAGVIGGFAQNGKYKLDCRFNKEELIKKIRQIEKQKQKIHFYNIDAIDFIKQINEYLPPEDVFFYIDPPYYTKGSTLYTNAYEPEDHKKISRLLLKLERPWVLTYDNVSEIQDLYIKNRQYNFDLNYSAANKRVGTELLITSNGISISTELYLTISEMAKNNFRRK